MPTKPKAKKAKAAKSAKAKTAPKKSNPKKPSAPMKKALDAVANMPIRKDTKLEAVIQLLSRPEGATIEDMVAATGWQKHTIRSALSHALAKKRGYEIVSDKPKDEQRIYKIASGPRTKQ
ncbi:MAG: DUF3489 domain-containing protein [Dongiaceae bacterium]